MAQALVSPRMIQWARIRRRMTEDALARSIQSHSDRIRRWESGDARPTFRQAQKLARTLHVPFGYLFLSEPPDEGLPLPDLRTIPARSRESPSSDFLDLLHSVRRKRDWYKEYLQMEGATPRGFVGSLTKDSDPVTIASAMREALGDVDGARKQANSWSDYIRKLVQMAEEAGILVFRSGIVGSNTRRKLDVGEVRGLAMSDPIAPAIFVNSADAKAAQVFTIAHELAHLWLGESGVSDISPDSDIDTERFASEVETVCNKAAAEFLTPRKAFLQVWQTPGSTDTRLQEVAREFRVSTAMVLRRAYDLGQITRQELFEQLDAERDRQSEPSSEQSGGNFRRSLVARNSRLLVTAVFESVLAGRSLYREAATVLDVRSSTIAGLAADFPFSDL